MGSSESLTSFSLAMTISTEIRTETDEQRRNRSNQVKPLVQGDHTEEFDGRPCSEQQRAQPLLDNAKNDEANRGESMYVLKGHKYHKSERQLGKRDSATVYLGMEDEGTLVALKIISRNKSDVENSKNDKIEKVIGELNTLLEIRHDNVLAYFGGGMVGGDLVIAMEYASGGSLQSILDSFGKIPARSLKRYLKEIIQGLAYLHEKGIVHKDISPHNILVTANGQCKLSLLHVTSTAMYMSPEACSGSFLKASNIWSLGVMTAQLLTGKIPSTSVREGKPIPASQFMASLTKDSTAPATVEGNNLPPVAMDFITQCVSRDPDNRPTAVQLLSHEFLM
jgi:serine/threonine protein kinase